MTQPRRTTARRTTSRRTTGRRTTARRSTASSREPAALRRFNKSLDQAQDALTAMRKDLTKDVGTGAKDAYKNLERLVKNARRDSGKFGTALQRDLEQLQKRLAASAKTARGKRAPAKRTARRTTTRRTSSGRSTARRSGTRRSS